MNTEENKIVRRIKNLLDMANDSSSLNEAAIAARRARALMDKYQVSIGDIELSGSGTFGQSEGNYTSKNVVRWVSSIAATAAHLNDCISIIASRGGIKRIRFCGFSSDTAVAKEIFDFLIVSANRMLKAANISGRSERNYYRLGFCVEIEEKVSEIVKERKKALKNGSGKSLVADKSKAVNDHFGEFDKFRPKDIRSPTEKERSASEKGMCDAKSISLSSEIPVNLS